MRNLYVMSGGKYGFAYDFYNYVLRHMDFDLYQMDFNKKLTRTRYVLKLLLKKYDVIWACESARALITLLAKSTFKKLEKCKLVTRYHRICGPAGEHGLMWGEQDSWKIYAPLFGSDAVAWTYNCLSDLQRYFPMFPKEKFFVVHNGVDLDFYKPDESIREEKLIFTVSNWFKPRKKLHILIEAMRILSGWRLKIGGRFLNRSYEYECKQLASSMRNRIEFLGFVSDERKRELMQRADVFVMPSEYEGWSTPVMEAMACGCKVLRVEGGGAHEFVPDIELLPHNFTAEMLAEKILEISRLDIREHNRECVKPFKWENVKKEAEKVLDSVRGE